MGEEEEDGHDWRTFIISRGGVKFEGTAPNNAIRTTKYTVATFLPKNLWEQLHKFGNCYFLSISIIMYLGEKTDLFVGTIKAFSTLATLIVMMCATATMAALDDYRRYESDRNVNGQKAKKVGQNGKTKSTTWAEIRVGNLILLDQDEEIPADVLLLCAPSKEGSCYISTANLDGETNLKMKSAMGFSQKILYGAISPGAQGDPTFENLSSLEGTIEAEAPCRQIHEFSGRATEGGNVKPLTQSNFLLRGAVLRSAKWALGIVVYTGSQTRMVMNSEEAPLKFSNLERVTNKVMFVVLAAQASLALMSMLLYLFYRREIDQYWYLNQPKILLPHWLGYWLTFFVLYSNLMPISLYPTMEVCNAVQALFIRRDRQMRVKKEEEEPPAEEDFFAGARSSNLCQELGQIEYIFSDKTGTLTQNVMKLRRIFVDCDGPSPQQGQCFGTMDSDSFDGVEAVQAARRRMAPLADQINAFLQVLAVAHTVMASSDEPVAEGPPDGPTRKYEAESPDESALVEGVAELGWCFEEQKDRTAVVYVDGKRQEYKLLAVNGFDSTRKRMSVLVEVQEGGGAAAGAKQHLLLVKGADNVMLQNSDHPDRYAELKRHLQEFSVEGLRTLVVGHRVVRDKQLLQRWLSLYQAAETSMGDRAGALKRVAEEMETQLQLLGVTGIEDKLQEDVGDTIWCMRQAGIKLWIATGDKLETAKNIGYSTRVLERDSEPAILETDVAVLHWTKEPAEENCTDDEASSSSEAEERGTRKKAVMITGDAWTALNVEEREEFIAEALEVPVVIACRVSPHQKAELVTLVRQATEKRNKQRWAFCARPPVCMAIGDGANDVTMLQRAQVGIGIRGKEGMQAVNNSDFYIGKFMHLKRLLLVHGRWNYRRTCKFTLYTFWRNAVQVLLMCFYTALSGFSGTSLFEDWIRLSFNFLCAFPIMATGCCDKDIKAKQALETPEMYVVGREGQDMGAKLILYTLLSALYHSLVVFFVTATAFTGMDVYGAGDYYTFGTAVYSCVIVDMNYRVIYLNHTHNLATVITIVGSIIGYFAYLLFYPCLWFVTEKLEPQMYHVPLHMAEVGIFWVCCVVAVPLLAMSVDMFVAMIWVESSKHAGKVFRLRRKGKRKGCQEEASDCLAAARTPCGYGCLDQSSDESQECSEGESCDTEGPKGHAREEEEVEVQSFLQQTEKTFCGMPWSRFGIGLLILGLGCILGVLGAWAYLDSRNVAQIRIHYDGREQNSTPISWLGIFLGDPLGTEDDEVHRPNCEEECRAGRHCTFQIPVRHNMTQDREGLLLYYTIEPFYQNYYDYMKSGVHGELLGKELDMGARARRCRPDETRVIGDDAIVPCGMEATTFFNDTIQIEGVTINQTGIAWLSDLAKAKPGPPDYPDRPHTSWLYQRYPDKVTKAEGATNEHFLVWSRPAALPRLWNHYGWIREDLVAGRTLNITVQCAYPLSGGMAKKFVITEVGRLGGRSHSFGYLLLVSGAIVGFLALYLIISYFFIEENPDPCSCDGDASSDSENNGIDDERPSPGDD